MQYTCPCSIMGKWLFFLIYVFPFPCPLPSLLLSPFLVSCTLLWCFVPQSTIVLLSLTYTWGLLFLLPLSLALVSWVCHTEGEHCYTSFLLLLTYSVCSLCHLPTGTKYIQSCTHILSMLYWGLHYLSIGTWLFAATSISLPCVIYFIGAY